MGLLGVYCFGGGQELLAAASVEMRALFKRILDVGGLVRIAHHMPAPARPLGMLEG